MAVEETVLAWHDALNREDVDALLALLHPDVELVGPRGSAHGHEVLREWAARAGLALHPREVYARERAVVVAERGEWRRDGNVVGEADVASVFRVTDGQVAYLARFDTLDEALEHAGLTARDRRTP